MATSIDQLKLQQNVVAPESDPLRLPLPSQRVERIDGLQVLRMIAVLLVAWTHAGQPFGSSGWTLPQFGIFGVDIFFVISGFILSLIVLRGSGATGTRPSVVFLRKRAIRIFPVYWVFALHPLLHHFHVHEGSTYVPAFFLLPGLRYPDLPTVANFSWTLIFEMFFYLLFGAILLFTSRCRAVWTMIVLLIGLVAAGAVINPRRPILIVALNPMLLEFAMGAAAALLYSALSRRPRAGWSIVAIGLCASLVLRTLAYGAQYQPQVLMDQHVGERVWTWGLAAALIVLGTVLASPTVSSPAGKLSVLLGNASYSTYLLSGFLFLRFSGSISHLARFVQGRATLAFFQVSVTVLVMALGLVFYLAIEKRLLYAADRLLPAPSKPARSRLASVGIV